MVVIGISHSGYFRSSAVLSLAGILLKTPEQMSVVLRGGCYVHENRREIVLEAKRAGASNLFFLDTELVVPPESLRLLLGHKKDVVGVSYNNRSLPLRTTVRFLDESFPKELFKAKAVGTGCLLVKMKVFESFSPWFDFEYREDGSIETGEDYFFCKKARDSGFDIWCDPAIRVGHTGDYTF